MSHQTCIKPFVGCLSAVAVCATAFAAEVDESRLPPPAQVQVDFTRDIQPIFETVCWRCHGTEKPKSGFHLDNREAALKGGKNNPDDIVPGNSAQSKLIIYVARLDEDMQMPPPDKGKPLTSAQVGLLRAWIDQGANWGATNQVAQNSFSISPTLRWISVSGDERKFRELEGVKEGWGGGIKHFSLEEQTGADEKFSAEGHALFPDHNLRIKLAVGKNDFGFARGGFEIWRKYYDDTGGLAQTLPTNSFTLNRDLFLDIGRAWIDFGLTLPDWPQVVLGYEYQFKRGNEATLQWGPVGTLSPFSPNTDAKNIYPAFKHIDEHTHILKLDVSYEARGWQLTDNARVEFYHLATSRQDALADTFGSTPDTVVRANENDWHTQGANTFNVSRQLKDWLSVSGGYLYSRLEGDASFQQNTLDGSGAFTGGNQWFANNILLKRETHAASLASLLGPWAGLVLSLAVQGEWTRQTSAGNEDLQIGNPGIPALLSDPTPVASHLNSASARENFSVRYTKLPYTVLYAETRLRQEALGRFEQRPDGSLPFTSDIDAHVESEEYRAGFNTSPWQRVSFGAGFKHGNKRTVYTHVELFDPNLFVYPGFLLWRDITDDEVEARLVLRVTRWLKTSLNCRFQETDFDGATAPVPQLTPGGHIEAANQQAHVYSFNAVLTPFRRLYLSSMLSYTDSRVATSQNGANYLAPYQGNIYSVLSSATFTVNTNTILNASHVFSKSDYGQNNQTTGLPAGIDYTRHELRAGITRRFARNLTVSLTYGFAQYRDPTSGGVNDFTAQMIFATVAIPWP